MSLCSPGAEHLKLVFTSACKFAQNKLLRQTSEVMQTHVNPEGLEHVPCITIRTWVVSGGDGISNQTAAHLRIVRLPCPVVSLADKRGQHGVAGPRPLRSRALVIIARVLMEQGWQNGVADQASGCGINEASTQPFAVSFGPLPPFMRIVAGLLHPGPGGRAGEEHWTR